MRRVWPIRLFLAALGVSAGLCAADKLPPIAPDIQGVFPHGGRQGSSLEVTITGKNLEDVAAVQFARPGLHAEVAGHQDSRLLLKFYLSAKAEPGRHDFRLISPRGSAIGWFDVGILPEVIDAGVHDSPARAQLLTLPVLVNGIVKKGEYKFFRIAARAGQTIAFDVNATRNGSTLDAVLTLFDESGEQLVYNDDYYIFKDPHLSYRFEKSGSYVLRLNGSEEGGSPTADYRLSVGSVPYVSYTVPAGARSGDTVTVQLYGTNLDRLRKAVLGDGLAEGKVLSASSGQATVRLKIPELPSGILWLHADGAMYPAPFEIGGLPEITVAGPASREAPLDVQLPVVANGVIASKGQAGCFRFHLARPAKVVLSADSMRLGYPLDPLVALYDSHGKRIAYQDEPNTNNGLQPANLDPHLVVDLKDPGDYTALIRDFAFRGDPEFVYRFTIKEADPDFEVRLHVPGDTFYRGHAQTIKVRIRRLEGWDAPVEIRAVNLPAGVTAKSAVAEPANTTYLGGCAETHIVDGTDVELAIEAAPDAPAAQQEIRIVAKGTSHGKTVEHEAWTRYRWHGKAWQDTESGRLMATIADPPPEKTLPQGVTNAKR